MNDAVVVGIDNGLDGGLVALSAWSGEIVAMTPMPCQKVWGSRYINVVRLVLWLRELNSPTVVALEETPKHAASSAAMRSMSISFGRITGACEARGIQVRVVPVAKWQSAMLGKRGSFSCTTKERALEMARGLWPEQSWLATERSSVAHDGMVDAALIAQYVRLESKKVGQ